MSRTASDPTSQRSVAGALVSIGMFLLLCALAGFFTGVLQRAGIVMWAPALGFGLGWTVLGVWALVRRRTTLGTRWFVRLAVGWLLAFTFTWLVRSNYL